MTGVFSFKKPAQNTVRDEDALRDRADSKQLLAKLESGKAKEKSK
jgi:hypothetical protein